MGVLTGSYYGDCLLLVGVPIVGYLGPYFVKLKFDGDAELVAGDKRLDMYIDLTGVLLPDRGSYDGGSRLRVLG